MLCLQEPRGHSSFDLLIQFLSSGSGTFLLLAVQTLRWGGTFFLRQRIQTALVSVWATRYVYNCTSFYLYYWFTNLQMH